MAYYDQEKRGHSILRLFTDLIIKIRRNRAALSVTERGGAFYEATNLSLRPDIFFLSADEWVLLLLMTLLPVRAAMERRLPVADVGETPEDGNVNEQRARKWPTTDRVHCASCARIMALIYWKCDC